MEYAADTVTIVRHFTNTGKIGRKAMEILEGAEKGKYGRELRFFWNIFCCHKGTHKGIILLKPPSSFTAEETDILLAKFLKSIDEQKITELITIVELGKYRIRKD